jgi:glycosyltransferase involved in cell wall biosynthesis
MNRILVLNTSGKQGGAEHSLLLLLAGLKTPAYQITLICPPDGGLAADAEARGVTVYRTPVLNSEVANHSDQYLRSFLKILRLAHSWQPDLLYGNGIRSAVYVVPIARLLRRPSVVHVRDMIMPPSRLTRTLLRSADAQIAISSAVKEVLLQENLLSKRHTVIYNGVDVTSFQRDRLFRLQIRNDHRIADTQYVVALFGRILEWKGHLTMVEAAGLLKEDPSIIWWIVGEEWQDPQRSKPQPFLDEIRAHCQALGIADRIHFLGYRRDIAKLMAACDCIVVPSIQPEPFGRVAIEAMAAGTSLVVARSGGLSEIVRDGCDGLVVEPNNASALAQAIMKLRSDTGLRTQLTEKALTKVRSHFDERTHVEQVASFWADLMRK